MHKILYAVLSLTILFYNYTASAQSKWGVKGGVAFASQSGESAAYSYRSGIAAGIFLNTEIPSWPVSFQPEVLYINKGSNLKTSLGTTDINSTFLFHYIEIPLLVKLPIPFNEVITPHIFAGPALSYLFGNVERRTSYTQTANGIDTSEINLGVDDYTEKFDYGVSIGGGVDFNLFSQNLTFEARYTHGIRNIIKQFENSETSPTVKNRAWMIMLGVGF